MGAYKQDMLKRVEEEEITMDCPACGKRLIVDQFEDVDLVYCSCGYTQMEECMCNECQGGECECVDMTDDGDGPHPALINEDDWRKER